MRTHPAIGTATLKVGVHEVAIDGVGLALKELPEHLDGAQVIYREVSHPAQVVGLVHLGGYRIRESGPHRWSRRSGRCHRAKAEVGWVVVQEDAEPTRAVRLYPAAHNGAGKRDRLAVLLLQGKQAGPVAASILTGQVADLEAFDPHRHGVGVVGVVRLGHQDGVHLHSHTIVWGAASSDDAPEVVLVAGLAHDFEVFSALVQLDVHAVTHPAGPLFGVIAGVSARLLLAASKQPS
jgi:hypothetical protein